MKLLLTINLCNAPTLQVPYKVTNRTLQDNFKELTNLFASIEKVGEEVLVNCSIDHNQHELEACPFVPELELFNRLSITRTNIYYSGYDLPCAES